MIRAQQYIGQKVQLDGKTYNIIKANNSDENCISLQNTASMLYLRHKDGRLIESDKNDNETFFASDSSFFPEERGDGFVLRCSNQGMEDNYICKLDIDTYIISEDLVEYVFFTMPFMHETRRAYGAFENTANYNNKTLYGNDLILNGICYLTVPSNDGHKDHISLLNTSNGLYARHFNGKIVESIPEDTGIFTIDSSFNPSINGDKLVLYCVNSNMENMSISFSESGTDLIIGNNPAEFEFQATSHAWPWGALKMIISNMHRIISLLEKIDKK